MALQTDIKFVRTGAITMAVALTLDGAVGADVAEVTTAYVGLHACASHAALCACRYANVSEELYQMLEKTARKMHFEIIEYNFRYVN